MGYYCGIDLASKRTALCVLDSRRQVIEEIEVSTTAKGLGKALKKYKKLKCVVEASPLAEWLSREVETLGHEVTIVCPRRAKVALASQGKKTDRRDARALAELCRSGWYSAVHKKSEEARSLRSFLTARKQLVQASTAIGSSIRGILRAHGLRLEASTDSESFGEEAKRVAEQLLEPVRYAIEQLVQSFELLHSQQLQMYKDLGTGQKEDPVVRRLKTIPGIGPATAAAFVATIDDPKRFADGEKVASYIGLVPSVYQSGDTEFRGKITKNGDKLLRWLLVEAAQTLLTRSKTPCELREWGLRIEAKKGLGKARVAVARRLCGLMWKLWVSGDVFHAESLRQAA